MNISAIIRFSLKLIINAWPSILIISTGFACCTFINKRQSVRRILFRLSGIVLILWGSWTVVVHGRPLLFLTLLSSEENIDVEFSAAHIDKYWDGDKIIHCLDEILAGTLPFSDFEKEQLLMYLARLLSRKEIPAGNWMENHMKPLPNIHPTIYYEYGYAEGIRTFRESIPNWVLRGINVYDLYRYFQREELGGKSLFAPFPVKNIGTIDMGDGIYSFWSLRNRTTTEQSVRLQPTFVGSIFRLSFCSSNNDSLLMPDNNAFHRISTEGNVVLLSPKTTLWIKAEVYQCDFRGAFTNVIIIAENDCMTNSLSICGEAR